MTATPPFPHAPTHAQAPHPPLPRQTPFNKINALVLLLVTAGGAVELARHGYLGLVNLAFILFGLTVLAFDVWQVSFELSRRRFLWLVGVASTAGYATQVVGSTIQGAWTYPPPHHFGYVRAMFVVAAVGVYGLTVALFAPLARRLVPVRSRKLNFVLVGALGVLFVVLGRDDRHGEAAVWIYYGLLFAFALYAAALTDLGTLLGLVASAIVVGGLAEWLGARSGLWAYQRTGTVPPAYLVFTSWPLESILHYGLSGILARESLLARPRFFKETRLFAEQREHPMWCGAGAHPVVSVRDPDKRRALDQVIEAAGFWGALERRRAAVGKSAAELLIALKPNFMFMYSPEDRSTFTDPALVEHLIDRMCERGYRNIALVEAQSAYGNYFHAREVPHVAEVVGYRPNGRYRIVDLTTEMVSHRFAGPLGDHVVGRTWRDADFRISFAKNKTHTWAWYTLCLKNIYGALPMQNKIREYHYSREIYYPTIDLLVAFPVHFGFVDAHLSADGPFGIFADRKPNPTETVLGGANILAVDWAGARKMGLDPMVSRYMQLAVQAFGRPQVDLQGDASPYPNWTNVPKALIDFWDHAEESYGFSNTVFSLMNREFMSDAFPPKPMTRFHRTIARLLAPLGGIVFRQKP
jgi:uncharacterized protein (DUF362 family)